MKLHLIIFLFLISTKLYSQKKFKIFLGNGFENDTCLIVGSYWQGDKYTTDTLVNSENITTFLVTGLAKDCSAIFKKNSEYNLYITINKEHYLFRIDKICRKSELRIEKYNGIELFFKYKGRFSFY